MPLTIEGIIERAFEPAFSKALDQTLQNKAEALFKRAFKNGSPLAKKLEEKIGQGFQKFIEEGIRWEKRNRVQEIVQTGTRLATSVIMDKDTLDLRPVRVYRLAYQLGMASKDLLQLCRQMGIDVMNQVSSLTEEESEAVKARVKESD
jgi:hypothetical protein